MLKFFFLLEQTLQQKTSYYTILPLLFLYTKTQNNITQPLTKSK